MEELEEIKGVRFIVPGKIQGKQRPKFTRVGNFVRAYTPAESMNYETFIKWHYSQQCKGIYFDKKPLSLFVTCLMPIPKSTSKKDLAAIKAGLLYPTKKPDADNVLKILCDALNKTAYSDDAQIVLMICKKKYSDIEGLEVVLSEYGSNN